MVYLLQALMPYVVLSGLLGFVVGWFRHDVDNAAAYPDERAPPVWQVNNTIFRFRVNTQSQCQRIVSRHLTERWPKSIKTLM